MHKIYPVVCYKCYDWQYTFFKWSKALLHDSKSKGGSATRSSSLSGSFSLALIDSFSSEPSNNRI